MFSLPCCLQVRTLQLEMEYIYGALEDEARDVVGDSKVGWWAGQGWTGGSYQDPQTDRLGVR